MTELELLSNALSMIDTAAMVTDSDEIVYMNDKAIALAEEDFTGKHRNALLPLHILKNQADSFTATALIGKTDCTVSCKRTGDYAILTFVPLDKKVDIPGRIISDMRSAMSNIKFADTCIYEIAEESSNASLSEYTTIINRNYYRVRRSLENIGVLSAIREGSVIFQPEPIEISDMIDEIVNTLNVMLRGKNIEMSYYGNEDLRFVIDRALFQQLMLNLISNSIAACPNGGKIAVSAKKTDRHLILYVDDNGRGIAPEELPQIFTQYKSSTAEKPSGCGLGLAVSSAIAELHGGAVILESRGLGLGTSVRAMFSSDTIPVKGLSAPPSDYLAEELRRMLTFLANDLPIICYTGRYED